MILKSIEAENILKYRSLRLMDLPEHGQIAVAGSNEAGKTAVGETICLGLFGRTFSLKPKDIGRVIRWGEFSGSVRLIFATTQGEEFSVTREIDNTGGHHARLEKIGQPVPLAEGVEEVAQAIRHLAGFTYQSFIDSFYLAQREMEVPHAKSATVKALIGVDKLEAVACELEVEITQTSKVLDSIQADIDNNQSKIAALDIDRARLGRLESEREAKLEAVSLAQTKSQEINARLATIGKAAHVFTEACHMFVKTTTRASWSRWCDREHGMAMSLEAVTKTSAALGLDAHQSSLVDTGAALKNVKNGLVEYNKIRDLAKLYRNRLVFLLDESPHSQDASSVVESPNGSQQLCYAYRQENVKAQTDHTRSRRKTTLVLGLVSVELALLTWTGWAIPETLIGHLFRSVMPLAAPTQSIALLIASLLATLATAVFAALYIRRSAKLKKLKQAHEAIEQEIKASKVELDLMDTMDSAPLPDAIEALSYAQNDLLHGAVITFSQGAGAVLIKADALSAKLAIIRDKGAACTRSIKKAQQRFIGRVEVLQNEAAAMRESVVHLDEQIAEERTKWQRLETLERNVAGLVTKANEARHQIVVRNLGRELIEGACRQIYARFHPELRRFVSRILPRLTEDRYEHLEIDDDLRVRVFCKEKNDFVGLAEISNGTHRQLMLCVRLALSQALIASSSKTAQFLFFDEPFVFFDEQRMAKAIDVLRRISPQITQVFLAAQRFDNPAAFDLCLDCDVERDTLKASGKPRRRIRVAG